MRILQVFRAPFGGLFRHVCDLVKAQSAMGHEVGVICDSTTGGERAADTLKALEPYCALGVERLEMGRLPGIGDAVTGRKISEIARRAQPDVMHGHGAKGGVYVRLATFGHDACAIYTPHGGSLHYNWSSPAGAIFLGAERMLLARTSGLVFVCDYERRTFADKIGTSNVPHTVVHNGLWPDEFTPATLEDDATDLLFIGEMRRLKGVDVMIEAIRLLAGKDVSVSATMVGDGGEREAFEKLAKDAGLAGQIRFTGAMPANEAFGLGRVMIVPSRAESFPYIILEAIAAHKPIIATNVGGIGEALPVESLVQADNPDALANAIQRCVENFDTEQNIATLRASQLKTTSNAETMARDICEFYNACKNAKGTRAVA